MTQQLQLYNMSDSKTEPAPTIMVSISSLTGTRNIKVLPDSGADISAAGQDVMRYLGHYKSNLVPSRITPRTVNESQRALISWKAAKELGILPPHYPYPQASKTSSNGGAQSDIKTTMIGSNIQVATEEQIMLEFPSVSI